MSEESPRRHIAVSRFRWLAGGAAVIAVLAVAAVGVGAAPSPVALVSEVLGLDGEHGRAVSEAVEDAKDSLEDGEKVGPAVSEAACTAAHDRTNLPEGAQNAAGQQDREPKDCTRPSNAKEGEPSAESEEAQGKSDGRGRGRDTAPGQLKKNQE